MDLATRVEAFEAPNTPLLTRGHAIARPRKDLIDPSPHQKNGARSNRYERMFRVMNAMDPPRSALPRIFSIFRRQCISIRL